MRFKEAIRGFSVRLATVSGIGLLLLAVVAGFTIRDIMHQERHALTKSEVETALSILDNYDQRSRKGEFSREEAQDRAKATLRAMRYGVNNKEYFFVTDMNLKLLIHPARPDLEDSNTGQERDPTGFQYPQSFLAMAKAGGGHTHYYFPRPGSDVPLQKETYSALYKPWGWVVNSGIYIEDIDATYWQVMKTFSLIGGAVFLVVSILAYLAFNQLENAMEGKRRAERESLQASKLAGIGQLAAGIAHEINTPAQYIGDNLQYLAEEIPALLKESKTLSSLQAADMLEAVADAQDGVKHISKIVGSLQEFAKPASSEATNLDINKSLENALTVSQNVWKPVAEVEGQFAHDLPPVLCLAGEINQVFLNLILNAAEAIGRSKKPLPGRILIETFKDAGDVVVRVSDTGTGIADNLRERIFDPFFTTKALGKGMGQGLAVSRNVIEVKHGGRIEVGGKDGEGAVFIVRLPVRMAL